MKRKGLQCMQTELKKESAFKRITSIRGMGQVFTVSIALVLMCMVFALLNENFWSQRNILSLLRQVSPILIIGMGQSYVLITGGIDLSIGSVVGMGSMISATLMTHGIHAALAIPFTILCCLMVGLINGTLVSRAKLPPFIATLGTMIIARGIAQLVNGNMNTDKISAGGSEFVQDLFYYGRVGAVYNTILIALLLFIVFFYVLSLTKTGRHIYAIGSNYEAARFSGVNVQWAETKAYLVSSFLASIVGLIVMAQSSQGVMDAGNGYELNAVAASVIGGVSTMGGQGLLLGTVVGACIWGVLQNGLQFAGAPNALKQLIIGIVVIVSVLIDRVARGAIDFRKIFGLKKKPNLGKVD